MRPVPPRLYRLSRLLRRIGLVALAVLLVYVGVCGYSASQIHVASTGRSVIANAEGRSITISTGIQVTNGGWVAISGVSINTSVWFPNGGGLIGQSQSPVLDIAAGTTVVVPVTLTVPLNLSSAARNGGISLLTHSLTLPAGTWANATYAGLATLHLSDVAGVPWGAPFYELNVTPGTPTANANGTATFSAGVFYINQAPFTEVGTLRFSLNPEAGGSCGSGTLNLNVPQNATFDQAVQVTVPASCDLAGGTITAVYTGEGFDVALPPESIP